MKNKKKILFVCVHNSGRSQMAEAFLQAYAGDMFHAESAGLEPNNIQNLVIEVMREKGIDLSKKTSDSVFDFYKQGRLYDFVITVCDESIENQRPVFPGIAKRLHWPFPDPKEATGTHEDKLSKVRKIRDDIENQIQSWTKEFL
jgi:arsenate reductase